MSPQILAQAAEITSTSNGEAWTFWLLAPVALIAALGMVLMRSAVHSALLLVVNLFCVAVFYLLQDAPFLGFVQIIVYTGAIMVLFLFVLMLVGVDSSDSLVETLRGQRIAAVILGLGFAGLLVFPIGRAIDGGSAAGLDAANSEGNVTAIGKLLFSEYVFVFEAISALLVVAAIGTMVLGHREHTGEKLTQKERMRRRLTEGGPITPRPGPKVFAINPDLEQAVRGSGEPAAVGGPAHDEGPDASGTGTGGTGFGGPGSSGPSDGPGSGGPDTGDSGSGGPQAGGGGQHVNGSAVAEDADGANAVGEAAPVGAGSGGGR
ncbi:NADH-quinone oxidoreductase subunit J [Parafrankia irregularis]|uniref:NADH-quinone oxidoreductase subunit J n=1 Tax=Parafrankia irregularis TaxID=795642 RepID=A0A0S4QIB8_9ACTN|nr:MULTISPECIES: NADH-quinone oxidoreductase subunit J [Parafrankia]MBE3203096.1 NADH-quinone oxidoreductase subunit J [Parafrankia sp. CH37]CUU54266.1 NADH-quinone oxidoreductase subunit J [Parafrankia irregularis]